MLGNRGFECSGFEIVDRHEHQVMIRSMLSRGARPTCPAGLTGTLVAIEGILPSPAPSSLSRPSAIFSDYEH
jgi:hypothetical protein